MKRASTACLAMLAIKKIIWELSFERRGLYTEVFFQERSQFEIGNDLRWRFYFFAKLGLIFFCHKRKWTFDSWDEWRHLLRPMTSKSNTLDGQIEKKIYISWWGWGGVNGLNFKWKGSKLEESFKGLKNLIGGWFSDISILATRLS